MENIFAEGVVHLGAFSSLPFPLLPCVEVATINTGSSTKTISLLSRERLKCQNSVRKLPASSLGDSARNSLPFSFQDEFMSTHLPVKTISPESSDSELQVRRMLDAIPQLAWRAFADGEVEFCNKNWIDYTGLTMEQAQGWGWEVAIHPDDLDEVVSTWRRFLDAGAPCEVEARMRAADGTFRWFLVTAMPMRDEQGRIVWWYGTNIDIDEHKRGEQKLRESEERFRLAAQAGKMFAYAWDAATDVIVRSAESSRILGIEDETILTGQQVFARVYPADHEKLSAAMAALSPQTPYLQLSYRIIRPGGTMIWVERNSRAHFDEKGRLLRVVGMVADVTERMRTEEALRESAERLRMAAEAGRMYAYEWDVATDTIVRSPECVSLLGAGSVRHTTRKELINWVHPDDHGLCGDLSAVSPQNPTLRARYRIARQDGTWMWAEKSARAFFDEQGKMVRMIGMIVDISERKLAEEALSSVSRRLIEAQEQERAHIARELHDDLSQRMALIEIGLEQFAQNIPDLTSGAREQLHNISEVASEVSSYLHNMSHQLHPSKLDLLGLVATVGSYCRELSAQQDLNIEFFHHNVSALIPKNVMLCLFRIVQEALRNVVKHSGASAAKIELSGDGEQIDLCISDNGVGFDPDSAAAQAGLGLISMRERLRLVGGHLSVESQPSHGSRIRVRVPLPTADLQIAAE